MVNLTNSYPLLQFPFVWYSEHMHEVFPFWLLIVVMTDFPVNPYANPPFCLQNERRSLAQIRWKLPQDSNERNRHKLISVRVSCTFWSSLHNGNKTGWDSNTEEMFFFSFFKHSAVEWSVLVATQPASSTLTPFDGSVRLYKPTCWMERTLQQTVNAHWERFKRSELVHSTEKIKDGCGRRGQMAVNIVLGVDVEYTLHLCRTLSCKIECGKTCLVWNMGMVSRRTCLSI